jgi:hypothetical protein
MPGRRVSRRVSRRGGRNLRRVSRKTRRSLRRVSRRVSRKGGRRTRRIRGGSANDIESKAQTHINTYKSTGATDENILEYAKQTFSGTGTANVQKRNHQIINRVATILKLDQPYPAVGRRVQRRKFGENAGTIINEISVWE